MKPAILAALLCVFALGLGPSASAAPTYDPETGWLLHQSPAESPSRAYDWLMILQEASGRSVDRVGARPTILSREMFVVVSAMYDAWSVYDAQAVGTVIDPSLRRPKRHRSQVNKETAISYAAYRALLAMYPEDADWITEQMVGLGYDPANTSVNPKTPAGIGNLAARAVVEHRLRDGANQRGDEVGSSGEPYSDYTFYEPRNPDDRVVDPDRWQRLPFQAADGSYYYPDFLTPHWYRVEPFALERADQFRPGPPPKVGSAQLEEELEEVVYVNGHLSHDEKTLVEFMRDGPRSTGQSGHWLHFAADISRRDQQGLDEDVKLFFTIGGVAFDAFIANWDVKRHYDSSRPWTLVRHLYGDRPITAYLGPCKGFGTIPANEWHPYSPAAFVTPPFPGYTSGHATVSAAASRMLAHFTGSDRLEVVAVRACGELTETECTVAEMQARDGVPAEDAPKGREVRLPLATLSEVAEMAAQSRLLGGYHIRSDNDVGLEHGRRIADFTWPVYESYFDGTARGER